MFEGKLLSCPNATKHYWRILSDKKEMLTTFIGFIIISLSSTLRFVRLHTADLIFYVTRGDTTGADEAIWSRTYIILTGLIRTVRRKV